MCTALVPLRVLLALSLGLGLSWLGSIGCSRAEPEVAAPHKEAELAYLELTTQGAPLESELPLLIVIHGLGDRPEGIVSMFKDLNPATRLIAPRAPDPWGDGASWYPIEDPGHKAQIIRARAARIAALITHIRQRRPTRGKAVVTGFSQGGALSFALAAEHARLLRGVVPIAGYLPLDFPAPSAQGPSLPVRAFHGLDDLRVPYAEAERTVRMLQHAGRAATLTGFPQVGHGISSEMRAQIYDALQTMLAP